MIHLINILWDKYQPNCDELLLSFPLLPLHLGEIFPPSHMHNPGFIHLPFLPHDPWLQIGTKHNPDLPLWLHPEQHFDWPLDLQTFGPRSWSTRLKDDEATLWKFWMLSETSPVSSGPWSPLCTLVICRICLGTLCRFMDFDDLE